jgi:glycosyltransferase domain-containing protein
MKMSEDFAASYTLVVPTFNRPQLLRRLLRYLELSDARFGILVLDSSAPEHKRANAEAVASVKLRIRRIEYDSALPPFEKFCSGMAEVETPFLSLCADDDIVVVATLAPIVDFLRRNADYSAAHGFYFNFQEQGRAGPPWRTTISSLFYRGPSLDAAEPAQRLALLFQRYEALTYAVYRREVAVRVYRESGQVQSMLARELLSGALTVIAGKTARLKVIYYGRSTGPSAGYRNWHPLEWLATDPAGMFQEYAAYRAVLAPALARAGASAMAPEEAVRLCDLIHLRYLSPYLDPRYLEFALSKNFERLAPEALIAEVWRFWNQSAGRGWRGLARKVLPGRSVASGANRYRFEPAFLYAGPRREVRVTRKDIEDVVSCLDSYSTALA